MAILTQAAEVEQLADADSMDRILAKVDDSTTVEQAMELIRQQHFAPKLQALLAEHGIAVIADDDPNVLPTDQALFYIGEGGRPQLIVAPGQDPAYTLACVRAGIARAGR